MMSTAADAGFLAQPDGLYLPAVPIQHRDDQYDPADFAILRAMQARHFWYRGRQRYLLWWTRRIVADLASAQRSPLAAIDLGGGCGGWVAYLSAHAPGLFHELALADSSIEALRHAAAVAPGLRRYQADLLNLPWRDRWDVAFALDVLEHIPQDLEALCQIRQTLRPGGHLVVTAPALEFFWSASDDMAHHLRRYSRGELERLAAAAGFEVRWSRYFMFLLSPLFWLSRRKAARAAGLSVAERRQYKAHARRVPAAPLNALLSAVFALETPLGAWLNFPWGTSVLGVFRKP